MRARFVCNGREFSARITQAQPCAGGLEWTGYVKVRGIPRLAVGLSSEPGRPPLLWQVV